MTVIFDATGATARAGFGVSSDLTVADFFAVDANGFSTGIGTFDAINFAGYFVDDSTPVGRQFGGLSLDGTFNDLSLADPNGVPRVFANQAALTTVDKNDHAGNGFGIRDASGNDNVGMFALADGSLSGFDVFDTSNNIEQLGAFLVGGVMTIETFDTSGKLTGHLP